MTDIQIGLDELMRQAGMTAHDYLSKASEILEKEFGEWSVRDAIELSKVMAQDFHTSMIGLKLQEIRDQIREIGSSIDNIAGAM